MADISDLQRALIAADRAGNDKDAAVLAEAIRRQQVQPTQLDTVKSHGASFFQGLMDPVDALAQLAPRGVSVVGKAASYVPGLEESGDDLVGSMEGEIANVDRIAKGRNAATQGYKAKAGREGFDITRLLGNIANPVNAIPGLSAVSKLAGPAATAGRLALTGGRLGLVSSAMQPVYDTENFAGNKVAGAIMGTIGGAVLTPVISKVGGALAQRVKQGWRMINRPSADKVIADIFADAGLKADDYNAAQMKVLRAEVDKSLKTGKLLDPAALARKMDFDDLKMKGLSGQVTQDPNQFARERNLRGVEGVGEPIQGRLTEQNRRLTELMGNVSEGASEPVIAGEVVSKRLSSVDKDMRDRVSSLYKGAREASNIQDDVPTTGLAQDLANIADDYGDALPGGLRTQLQRYGFMGGKQTKIFNFDEAEKMLKATNRFGSKTDDGVNSSLDAVRKSIKEAIMKTDDAGGPFALPRAAAKQRFDLQKAVPALEDAARGKTAPDTFIQKYVIGAPVAQVKEMHKLLDKSSREEVRRQIGEKLRAGAFGEDTGVEKIFVPERYMRTLKRIGESRLKVFFSPEEVLRLKRIGRVGAYVNTHPANAAVNTSSTNSALYNLARATGSNLFKAPLLSTLGGTAKQYADRNAVNYALQEGIDPLLPILGRTGQARLGLLSGAAPVVGGLLAGSPNR